MLGKLKKKVIEFETRPVILHEIPGRVRLGLKVIKRLKKENMPLVEHLKSLLEDIPALSGIKVNNLSGSIVINYDQQVTDARGVQVYLQEVIRYLIGYSEEILRVPERALPDILEKLSILIRDSTSEKLKFTPESLDKSFWQVVPES